MITNKQSIIILPFRNGTSEEANEFLCDGIAEELITLISANKSFRVISRKSAFTFKGKDVSSKTLRKELGVDFVVEGMIRLSARKIRVNAELIDAADNHQIWSGKWDRPVEGIFDLEDEMALLISDKIRENVGHFEIAESPKHRQKIDFEVYQKLLEAKFLFYKWNPNDVSKAIALFENVLEKEPTSIDALIGLSDAYSFMATTNFMNPAEAWKISEKYTEAALQLNPEHAGVHYLQSHNAFFTKGNFSQALISAHKAVDLNPTYTDALQFLAFFYTLALKKEVAKQYLEKALNLDPLNQETLFFKALIDYRFGQPKLAIEQFDALISHNPYNLPAIVSKSYALIKTKQYEYNLEFLNSLPNEILIPDERLGLTCVTYAAAGNVVEAERQLSKLQIAAREPSGLQAKCYLYWTYCLLGNTEQAMQIARNMKGDNINLILIFFGDPVIELVFDSPAFKTLFAELYQIPTFKFKSEKKAPAETISDEKLSEEADRLRCYMEEEEPFLNPKLSLRDLARSIEMHPNQLSLVLNASFNKNFNSFVNDYRINYFKALIKDQSAKTHSLIGLAYESGFNSKTVFNTYFKKVEGITPKEYLKNH
jgi:TolB-like protein/AraC-like DNA-binding protein